MSTAGVQQKKDAPDMAEKMDTPDVAVKKKDVPAEVRVAGKIDDAFTRRTVRSAVENKNLKGIDEHIEHYSSLAATDPKAKRTVFALKLVKARIQRDLVVTNIRRYRELSHS